MKRIISIVLALVTVLTLDITAFAANGVTQVIFTPAEPIVLTENTDGLWIDGENGDRFFWYSVQGKVDSLGNKITVKKGTLQTVYEYREYVYYEEYSEQYMTAMDYLDSNDNHLLWQWDSDQDNEHWYPGGTYSFSLIVDEVSCSVPVTVEEGPVKSIELEKSVSVKENTNGYPSWIYDFENEKDIPYYNYIENDVLGQAGLSLKVNYSDGSTGSVKAKKVTLTFDDGSISYYVFVDENGNEVDLFAQSNQTASPFKPNGKNVIRITYLGRELEIPVTVVAASKWTKYDGKWYYVNNGYCSTLWQKISGKWYYFDRHGEMQTGWKSISGHWYYLGTSGAMATGWTKVGKKWYYLGTNGAMRTGWMKQSGKWYYLDESGKMAVGWTQISSLWYYFNADGTMKTGWMKQSGKWYYFFPSGEMAKGRHTINGKQYRFKPSGECANP